MSNLEFVWFFTETALGKNFKGPFSLEYVLPKLLLHSEPLSLINTRIWLVVNIKGENYLYAVIYPSSIEQFEEGKYKGDFLLNSDPYLSIRFLPRHESLNPWIVSLQNDQLGIRALSDFEQKYLIKTVNDNSRVSFSLPTANIIESLQDTQYKDIVRIVPDLLMKAIRSVAFGDTSRVHSFPDSLSGFGGVVLSILKQNHSELDENTIIKILSQLDPILSLSQNPLASRDAEEEAFRDTPPIVDTYLETIDSDMIYPRIFVIGRDNDQVYGIDKTEIAEKEHQVIVKELVTYLNSKGFNIYKTRSFDILAKYNDKQFLWEIKSANYQNIISQGEKGILQLLRYSLALADTGNQNVKLFLLINDTGQTEKKKYLSRMARQVGVEIFYINRNGIWPNKVTDSEFNTLLIDKYT